MEDIKKMIAEELKREVETETIINYHRNGQREELRVSGGFASLCCAAQTILVRLLQNACRDKKARHHMLLEITRLTADEILREDNDVKGN